MRVEACRPPPWGSHSSLGTPSSSSPTSSRAALCASTDPSSSSCSTSFALSARCSQRRGNVRSLKDLMRVPTRCVLDLVRAALSKSYRRFILVAVWTTGKRWRRSCVVVMSRLELYSTAGEPVRVTSAEAELSIRALVSPSPTPPGLTPPRPSCSEQIVRDSYFP